VPAETRGSRSCGACTDAEAGAGARGCRRSARPSGCGSGAWVGLARVAKSGGARLGLGQVAWEGKRSWAGRCCCPRYWAEERALGGLDGPARGGERRERKNKREVWPKREGEKVFHFLFGSK